MGAHFWKEGGGEKPKNYFSQPKNLVSPYSLLSRLHSMDMGTQATLSDQALTAQPYM